MVYRLLDVKDAGIDLRANNWQDAAAAIAEAAGEDAAAYIAELEQLRADAVRLNVLDGEIPNMGKHRNRNARKEGDVAEEHIYSGDTVNLFQSWLGNEEVAILIDAYLQLTLPRGATEDWLAEIRADNGAIERIAAEVAVRLNREVDATSLPGRVRRNVTNLDMLTGLVTDRLTEIVEQGGHGLNVLRDDLDVVTRETLEMPGEALPEDRLQARIDAAIGDAILMLEQERGDGFDPLDSKADREEVVANALAALRDSEEPFAVEVNHAMLLNRVTQRLEVMLDETQQFIEDFSRRINQLGDYTESQINNHRADENYLTLSREIERQNEKPRSFGDLFYFSKRYLMVSLTEQEAERGLKPTERDALSALGFADGVQKMILPDRAAVRDHVRVLVKAGLAEATAFAEYPTSKGKIDLGEVESVAAILKRQGTADISLGAYTPDAHGANAYAMNQFEGQGAGSGEGSRELRYDHTRRANPNAQVASGRFGVTPQWLVSLPPNSTIRIKIAQGAKPGMGGQLPGFKVDEMVAARRGGMPGVELISPSNNHDLYSIEDIQQLIHELKGYGHDVDVKLAGMDNVGTIACGVAKAGADVITLAGNSGGTGASPDGALRHSGTPIEQTIREAHIALAEEGLRAAVKLRASTSSLNAQQVMKLHAYGADYVEDGTLTALLMHCVMKRDCHSECPVGITTKHNAFRGDPALIERFYVNRAAEMREIMAELGISSVGELVGNMDLLQQLTHEEMKEQGLRPGTLDFSRWFAVPEVQTLTKEQIDMLQHRPRGEHKVLNHMIGDGETTLRQAVDQLVDGTRRRIDTDMIDIDNSVAAMGVELGAEAARFLKPRLRTLQAGEKRQSFGEFLHGLYDNMPWMREAQGPWLQQVHSYLQDNWERLQGFQHDPAALLDALGIGEGEEREYLETLYHEAIDRHAGKIFVDEDVVTVNLRGPSGQGFGVGLAHGVHLHLEGTAQDGVGKWMSGCVLSIVPPKKAQHLDYPDVLGTCAFYGATGGRAYIAGEANARFAIRNSGLTAVVDGVGAHAGEYMTKGTILNLGKLGMNAMAGASAGVFLQYDPEGRYAGKFRDNVKVMTLDERGEQEAVIQALLTDYVEVLAQRLVKDPALSKEDAVEALASLRKANDILVNWEQERSNFVVAMPTKMLEQLRSEAQIHKLENTYAIARRDASVGMQAVIEQAHRDVEMVQAA